MKSVMTKDFSRVASTDISRSTFDRSHGLKTAFDSGYLVPVELQEVLPSDTVTFNGKFLARLAPVVTPVMDNVFLDLHAFFIPSRLVWNNFVKMMGERVNPQDSIDYVTPKITLPASARQVGSLADYFGIPVADYVNSDLAVNVLPFRAYQKVFDDWFRDENLQDSIIQNSNELGDSTSSIDKWVTMRKRGKRHDYLTSCLPWPQKGEGVNLPIGSIAPVIGVNTNKFSSGNSAVNSDLIGKPLSFVHFKDNYNNTAGVYERKDPSAAASTSWTADGQSIGLAVDLADATAATISSLRMAFQLQRMLEADARGGTRYVEVIRNHFKTICPDARLQRSEFLGSSSIPISFNPIAQTSGTTDGSTPQGNLAATAHAFGNLTFTKSFTEHGFILVLASVRCDLNYQQGLSRLWTRNGRYDYYWPTLAHLSEQAVLNKEIYCKGDSADNDVFGYQERYAEYRYNPSMITGKMRSGVDGSLDVWHLAQFFEDRPVLSAEFIEEDPPLDRVLAVTEGEPQIIMDCFLGQKWTRPLPVYSIPGLVDHF